MAGMSGGAWSDLGIIRGENGQAGHEKNETRVTNGHGRGMGNGWFDACRIAVVAG